MIGALLIVGGNDIVPFHLLPNPTDDSDPHVPSDNPYATLDENYFVQQWPVGRLPDEKGKDAGYLLEQLRFLNNEYGIKKDKEEFLSATFCHTLWRFAWLRAQHQPQNTNHWESAEVWKSAFSVLA